MKAVIATTYDNNYLYFLPITVWCWQKLNVEVICFMPHVDHKSNIDRMMLATDTASGGGNIVLGFNAPEHKQATYAQCSRLYAASLDLPGDEILVTSDVDMALFQIPPFKESGFTVFGSDLVPPKQYPMCYLSASVRDWRSAFDINGQSYQQCLDAELAHIETEHFRGNYWGKDQELAFNHISETKDVTLVRRSNGQNQFATKRYDRDDAYVLERLNPDTIDFHFPRPGYTDQNFEIIRKVLEYHYPYDDFAWLENYNKQYKSLL